MGMEGMNPNINNNETDPNSAEIALNDLERKDVVEVENNDLEIKEIISSAGDDIETFKTEIIPSLPIVYTSSGREISQESLIKALEGAEEGYLASLDYITNRGGLRDKMKDLIEVKRITEQVVSAKDSFDLITEIIPNLPDLRSTSGNEIDKGKLIEAIDKFMQDGTDISDITRRYKLRETTWELKRRTEGNLSLPNELKETIADLNSQNEEQEPSLEERREQYELDYQKYLDLKEQADELSKKIQTMMNANVPDDAIEQVRGEWNKIVFERNKISLDLNEKHPKLYGEQ